MPSEVKPVLYLPTRPILVPCDFKPKSDGNVVWREYTFNAYFEYVDTKSTIYGKPVYIKRPVEELSDAE